VKLYLIEYIVFGLLYLLYCSIFLRNNLLFCMIFFFLVFVGYFFLFTGDAVLVRGPFPQVDKPAPFGAERPELIIVPSDLFFTDGTDMFLFPVFHGLDCSMIARLLTRIGRNHKPFHN
jgi:hypothetical protein